MTWLLAISIGPVQDFIAAARRTRDLWHGSTLLSEVAKACAKALEAKGAKLIFPYASTLKSVPNKILAELECAESEVRDVVKSAEAALRNRLRDEARVALQYGRRELDKDKITVDKSRFEAQLEGFLEFFAAWRPKTGDYKRDRSEVEMALNARKVTRDFSLYEGQAGIPKSTLDGSRESVLDFRDSEPGHQFHVRPNEHLDAIGLVKRFGRGDTPKGGRIGFDSTHDVAAVPYVNRLKRSLGETLKAYEAQFGDAGVPFSYSYLYRHEAKYFEKAALYTGLQPLIAKLRSIRPEPPYYAVFQGDGDAIGTAISRMCEQTEPEDRHRDFSRRLSEFAEQTHGVVEEHEGLAVYTGGDDVLALLPLHRAIACARALRGLFSQATAGLDDAPTFSAGLAVVHALDPFTESRRMAIIAEKAAKKVDQKDALCVMVCPRSGADVSAKGKWASLPSELEEVSGLYNSGQLSKSLAHELAKLSQEWQGEQEALRPLALAIADKKSASKQARSLIERQVADRASLEHLAGVLFVARPFARALREAEGRPEVGG